ncbi:hypothetical protein DL89DRAFT_142817 [Linderina pennispora]|uniref:Uncharacterized protein n=1 Tax=Linderina pennispora TaxID=61395 RepID=A0A1Y1WBH1_9FUNG|nr:uncharacterized protein DL89DRAFT_142817 [Linderina pennispora]ORX70889.1 hypothetical protein DL89DRAFT_142817 [Linderina pennispora]
MSKSTKVPTSPCSLTSLPTPSRSTHAFDISTVRPQRRYSSAQNLHSPQSVRESAARRLDIGRPRTEVVLQRTPTSLYERTRQPTSHPSNLMYLASSSSSSQLGGMYSPSLRQSRRASIVLQSNSFNLPAALPATGQLGGPRTAHAGDPRSLTSTKSLPYQSAEQERRRRRSIAHERYPPLVSIFEDLQSDVGRSPIKETEVNNAAFFAAADICAIHECPQKMADEPALVKRTHSSSSLISVFSFFLIVLGTFHVRVYI